MSPALRAVSDAVLSVAAQLSVDEVLQRLVHSARELVGARYAALGIPDGAGGFRRFLVSGMTDAQIAALGPMPRTHGMLGAMLESAGGRSYITDDIRSDPRFVGGWPRGHPDMHSFLGVPIVAREQVIGAFYLTQKRGGFTDGDRELTELLAAHAAIAITNAQLYERSRELSILSERNRLALELHDVVSQKLFSLNLVAETAATLVERDAGPEAVRGQLDRVRALAQESLGKLRSLILGLRPPELERDGLAGALAKEVDMIGRAHGVDVRLRADCEPALGVSRDAGVLRIAHEALHNAVRHAAATHVTVTLEDARGAVHLRVADDGRGFTPSAPELRSRHLGLTSMEERAAELGGRLWVQSAPGAGTTVTLTVPADDR